MPTSDAITLFSRDMIDDPGSRGFVVDYHGQPLSGFVVCRGQRLFAYVNSCPHTGAPLDWVDHQFLDREQAFIQCAVHDARFEIDSGRCIVGPCVGKHLKALKVAEIDRQIVLQLQSC